MGAKFQAQYAALDLGAGSGRAMLGTYDGARLTLTEAHRFPNEPVAEGERLYWDFERLWGGVQQGIARAAALAGGRLDGIAVDTWGVDYGLLDAAGQLTDRPRHYRDPRTHGMQERAFARLPRERIFAATGIQFMPINTLYQLFAQVAAQDPALARAERLLMTPDLFNFRLTGRAAAERTIASTSQCYNPSRDTWADDVLAAMDIPRGIFPEIVAPGTVLAPLKGDLAAALGLKEAPPVLAVGSHDTASAVAAVPLADDGEAYLSSGTWSLLGVETRAPVITPESLRWNFTNEAGVAGTIRLLKNITGLWIIQELRRGWAAGGEELRFEDLAALAHHAAPFAHFIDPNDEGFLAPGDMPSRIAAYCRRTGQPVPAERGAFIRAAYESLVFKYRQVVERLEALTGRSIHTIHVVGGGTRNADLNQWTANATGRRVRTGPAEATAAGNVLMQMMATGRLGSPAGGRALMRASFASETFKPAESARWNDAYAKFLAITEPPASPPCKG